MQTVKSGIIVEVVGIVDDYGPTIRVPEIDAIVGSLETEKGCLSGIVHPTLHFFFKNLTPFPSVSFY